jgi:hypothetical protein
MISNLIKRKNWFQQSYYFDSTNRKFLSQSHFGNFVDKRYTHCFLWHSRKGLYCTSAHSRRKSGIINVIVVIFDRVDSLPFHYIHVCVFRVLRQNHIKIYCLIHFFAKLFFRKNCFPVEWLIILKNPIPAPLLSSIYIPSLIIS